MDRRYNTRATRGFTPEEAATYLEEAMADTLRTYPDEAEALYTLINAVREAAQRVNLTELAKSAGIEPRPDSDFDIATNRPLGPPEEDQRKMRIYVNRNNDWTPNKMAAHAVHAALTAVGAHTGMRVVVLDKGPTKIEEMRVVIHDAGHTELEPGTLTAGTDWPNDSEM